MQIKSVIDLGRMIRLARQQKGWSQSILAEELGTSQRWVSEIENGKSRAEVGKALKCLRVLEVGLNSTQVEPSTKTSLTSLISKGIRRKQTLTKLVEYVKKDDPDQKEHEDES